MSEFDLAVLARKALQQRGGFEDDEPNVICRHPEHNPPMGLYIPEGKRYRHICPGCGFEVVMRSSCIGMEARAAIRKATGEEA